MLLFLVLPDALIFPAFSAETREESTVKLRIGYAVQCH